MNGGIAHVGPAPSPVFIRHAEQWGMDTVFDNVSEPVEPVDPFDRDPDLGTVPDSFPGRKRPVSR